MPLPRSHIRTTVEAYLARHPHERESLAGLLSLLDRADDPADRATLPGHVTCSAAIIDREQRVLHIGHRVTGLLLTPGGHVEHDRTLMAAALREVCEETGLRPGDLCLTPQFLGAPIDIDMHDINANPIKGEDQHQHFDVRFAFYLVPDRHPQLILQDAEVAGAQWLAIADVTSSSLRAKLLAAREKGLDGQPEPVNASALIHNGHGRYLLHLRDQSEGICAPNAFSLLGGGRTLDDVSLEATLRRELAEQVPGLEVDGLAPYALKEATSVDGFAVPVQVFEARWSGEPETADLQEGVLLRWCTPDMLEGLHLSPGLGDLIRHHAAEHPSVKGPPDTVHPSRDEAPAGTEPHIVGVHLYLQDEHGRILLGLRHPSSKYAPNQWHFLAGHCERESAIRCLLREAKEEAGLVIEPADVELVHLVHHVDSPVARPRIGLVFRARSWTGVPQVLEPDRCVEWRFWNSKNLPVNVVPYTRAAIEGIGAGSLYTEMGWGAAMTAPQSAAASWPEHFTAHRGGHGCPMCANDWQADDIGWGLLLHRGAVSQSYLWRSGQVRGYAVVIFTARHVAEPTEMSEGEAAAFWRDALAVGRAIEEHYQPVLKMNYQLLGNAIPHAHFHLTPRREAPHDPAPGRPLPFTLLDHGRQDEALLQHDAQALRRMLKGAA